MLEHPSFISFIHLKINSSNSPHPLLPRAPNSYAWHVKK